MTQTAPAPRIVVTDEVQRWRLEELVRAGYRPWDALTLSRRTDVDLHAAVALLGKGCSTETALRILL
jgi:hypothetical protein